MIRLLLVLLLAGCAGDKGDSDTGTEPQPDPDPPLELIGEDVPWDDKTDEEKYSWMLFKVYPQMNDLFVAYDDAYDGTFKCENCHGDAAKDEDYTDIPSETGPPALSVSDWPSDSTDPDIRDKAAFMEDEVAPLLAELLGTTVGLSANQVSCSTCHRITQ